MRIKYKLFPYPVLCEEIDDYKENGFKIVPTINQDINRIIIGLDITLEDTKIKEMIKDGILDIVYHIECAKTLYRQIFIENELFSQIYIDKNDLDGNIDICCFIVAKNNISSYKNSNFNDDYEDNSFYIEKGNIMGFYNIPRINITKDPEELAKMSSIFSIIRKDDNKEEIMDINIDDDKIKICLGKQEFDRYNLYGANYQDYCHAFLILPTLIYAFDMIAMDQEDYSECRWFSAIEKSLSGSNIIFNKETIIKEGSYKLAQKLLNLPINRALKLMDSEEE
ncbi:hypothetical protein [Clostridium sp. ZBS4]|uniref:hypothetical protein n=1 Tax=Clostridium sp. ZBS4 TaxID=2949974 RepID=UPI00207A5E7B|nr:hypothetical protein [Clostridium sp. ZBS4]